MRRDGDRRRGRDWKTRGKAAWEKVAVEDCEGREQKDDKREECVGKGRAGKEEIENKNRK